jgi:hypothetical protein
MRTYETGITESSELIVSRCLALLTAETTAPLEGGTYEHVFPVELFTARHCAFLFVVLKLSVGG